MARNFYCCCISNTLSSTFAGCLSLRTGLFLLVLFDMLAVFGFVPSGVLHKMLLSSGPFAWASLAFGCVALFGLVKKNTVALDVYFWSQMVSFLVFFIAFFLVLGLYCFIGPMADMAYNKMADNNILEAISKYLGQDIGLMIAKAGKSALQFVLQFILLIAGNLLLLKWYIMSMINSLVEVIKAGGSGDEYKNAHQLKAESLPLLPMKFVPVDSAAVNLRSLSDDAAATGDSAMGATKSFANTESFNKGNAETAAASFVQPNPDDDDRAAADAVAETKGETAYGA